MDETAGKASIRYGIAEMFGHPLDSLSKSERDALVKVALSEPVENYPLCPFRLPSGTDESRCSKRHGICSLRRYVRVDARSSRLPGPEGSPTITCPLRFQERLDAFSWAGQEVLRASSIVLVKEVPFLEVAPLPDADERVTSAAVGRIDMILVDQMSLSSSRLEWCALEIQAVYFSGTSMDAALRAIGRYADEDLPFPDRIRRPDYRSSAPKRLMPQLQIKVPALRRWGKKMAVVVDRHFFEWMGPINYTKDISSCDIVWLVTDIVGTTDTDRLSLVLYKVAFTTLEDAIAGLTGGSPLALTAFEERIRSRAVSGVVLPDEHPASSDISRGDGHVANTR